MHITFTYNILVLLNLQHHHSLEFWERLQIYRCYESLFHFRAGEKQICSFSFTLLSSAADLWEEAFDSLHSLIRMPGNLVT